MTDKKLADKPATPRGAVPELSGGLVTVGGGGGDEVVESPGEGEVGVPDGGEAVDGDGEVGVEDDGEAVDGEGEEGLGERAGAGTGEGWEEGRFWEQELAVVWYFQKLGMTRPHQKV
ncbi:hypothetical protein TorRG33x02_326350 [Trema orientale]|uniref:Uncharacterized protein n=1 Tax=Trema orientale TaxID=63057 RepID=A0A2P5BC12_TREOI|nr:hypothetical protein TorRG33x02_326350 [Trema orientale]